MKKFVMPEVEITAFESEDVLMTSGLTLDFDAEDQGNAYAEFNDSWVE